MVQFNDTDLSIGNAFQIIECAVNLIGRNAVIALTVANGEIKWIKFRSENHRNVRNPPLVLQVRGILYGKAFAII